MVIIMKNIYIFVLAATLCLVACSRVLLEPMLPERAIYGDSDDDAPLTRVNEPLETTDESELLHELQTNHYLLLMHHVVLRDSTYVQSLTEADFNSLDITEQERTFSFQYVTLMNEQLKLFQKK